MVAGRKGFALLEILAAMTVMAVLAVSAAVVLQGQAQGVQRLYEERVAWEAAAGQMELLEADGFRGLREGSAEVAVESPGWENLEDPRCAVIVEPMADGMRRVTVRVDWAGYRGGRRQVEVRTAAGGGP